MLRLETAPTLSIDADKGKGIVFDYDEVKMKQAQMENFIGNEKIMSSTIQSGLAMSIIPRPVEIQSDVV